MVQKKSILMLGNFDNNIDWIREELSKRVGEEDVRLIFTFATNGVDASMKVTNQKYDIVLVDTEVPRLLEGGFVHGLPSNKNVVQNEVYIVSTQEKEQLHPSLQEGHYFKKGTALTDLVNALIESIERSSSKKNVSRFAVDVRIINAVVKATLSVCEQFGLKDVQIQKAESRIMDARVQGDVASLMPIKSKSFTGALITSFDHKSYLQMVSTMLGEEQTEINADNADAIGEICNIIFGNAKADLAHYGVAMVTPQILSLQEPLNFPAGSARMLIPFAIGNGMFYIDVIAFPSPY